MGPEIAKHPVLDDTGAPVQHQQARAVAGTRRSLSNQVARKRVVEVGEPEAQSENASFVVAGRRPPFTRRQ